jgi:DNA (cytosine-5)-methyltransferase 1
VANNQGYPKLKLNFHGKPIKFGEVRTEHGKPIGENAIKLRQRLAKIKPTDRYLSDVTLREEGIESGFSHGIFHDSNIATCITGGGNFYRACDKSYLSDGDYANISTFPQDYDFCGNGVQYVCGMSVPPNMMANIATQIWEQWLSKEV